VSRIRRAQLPRAGRSDGISHIPNRKLPRSKRRTRPHRSGSLTANRLVGGRSSSPSSRTAHAWRSAARRRKRAETEGPPVLCRPAHLLALLLARGLLGARLGQCARWCRAYGECWTVFGRRECGGEVPSMPVQGGHGDARSVPRRGWARGSRPPGSPERHGGRTRSSRSRIESGRAKTTVAKPESRTSARVPSVTPYGAARAARPATAP
jgi:hypothetical protein